MNKTIAQYFLTDANDFLKRFKLLEENSTHIGLRSKLLIELLFSVECALKALIFIESNLDEKQTYKKAKKAGHTINKLSNNLKPESQLAFKQIVTIDLSKFAIYNRYQIESEIDFREENGSLGKKYYETIANFNWLHKIYDEVQTFINFVQDKIPVNIEPKSLSDIDIELALKSYQKIRNIR